MTVSFVVPDDFIAKDIQTIEGANVALAKMRGARITRIDISEKYIRSKLSWKLATFREPMLYRVVALIESFAVNWNSQNLLGAYLPARALIEASALLLELESDIRKYLPMRDMPAIDALLMNRLFSTRDAEMVRNRPTAKAVNIVTLIDRLDKRVLEGIRVHYDIMSEICHPNALGHRYMYGEFDNKTGSTAYSEIGRRADHQGSFLATMVLVMILDDTFTALESAIDKIAEFQTN